MSSACPFIRKIFIPEPRIERNCGDALRSVGLMPDEPTPIRIDRFAEKHFGIEIEYEDLSTFGPGVMGACRFKRDGSVSRILVEAKLAEQDSKLAEKVVRSTIAHEAGHGLFHGELFAERFQAEAEMKAAGFFEPSRRDGLLPDGFACRGLDAPNKAFNRFDWWEVQANMAMAALLLPMNLVSQHLDLVMKPLRTYEGAHIIPSLKDVCGMVADRFEVSVTMARYRIEAEYERRVSQPSLF
jgi:hypothetical protein